jgi:hypothetical protein
MRGVALALLAGLLGAPAFGQVAVTKAPSPHASLCEIAKHPEQFEGKSVKIHARYSVNWEWGAWVWDEQCGWGLGLVLANGYPTPAYLSELYVERDSAFDAFQQKEKLLCSVDVLCEFDFLEADFTGIVVGDNHFPVWSKISNALKRLVSGLIISAHSCFLKPQQHVQSGFDDQL